MSAAVHIELSEVDQEILRQTAHDRGVSVEAAAAHLLREALQQASLQRDIALGLADAEAGRWANQADLSGMFAKHGVQWP